MNPMTTDQAYVIIEQVTGAVPLNRETHQQVIQALDVIRKAITLNQEEAEQKKSQTAKDTGVK